MALNPGVSAAYTQQPGETVLVTFDFNALCKNPAGNGIADPLASAVVTASTGLVLGTKTIYSATVTQLVGSGALPVGATIYAVLCVATTTGGQVRNLALQCTITDKAVP